MTADGMDALRSAAAGKGPDDQLLGLCERYIIISEEITAICRARAENLRPRLAEISGEIDGLAQRIAKIRARTANGRRAKAECGAQETRGAMKKRRIAHSTLLDFIAANTVDRDWRGPATVDETAIYQRMLDNTSAEEAFPGEKWAVLERAGVIIIDGRRASR